MTKRCFFVSIIIVLLGHVLFSAEPGVVSIKAGPVIILPVGTSTGRYSTGGGGELSGEYVLPFLPFSHILFGLEYNYIPLLNTGEPLTTIAFGSGAGVHFSLFPNFDIKISGESGYFIGIFQEHSAGSLYVKGNFDINYTFTSSFSLGAGADYRNCIAGSSPFYEGIGAHITLAFHFGGEKKKIPDIKIRDIELPPLFPVFCKFYDENPLGKITLKNSEKGKITDIRVSFFVNQYMDSPKECLYIDEMKKDEEKEIQLYALFSDRILKITEATKIQADIMVTYRFQKDEFLLQQTETIRVFDRNAMTWDDTRKAAAFVTPKDPHVLQCSKNIAGIVREMGPETINSNFRIAMGLFEGLSLYGIHYVKDVKAPYASYSKNTQNNDFLQFPVQTMNYKGGDCDDLSILYCALLESIGIRTAFITIPNHIFAALNLGMTPEKAKMFFLHPEDLIFMGEETWIPVEITMIKEGFIHAWQAGAREWRENTLNGKAGFFPIHEAWELYEPVGIIDDRESAGHPDKKDIEMVYSDAFDRFIREEVIPEVERLKKEIHVSSHPLAVENNIGLLYAQYGLYDEAEEVFLKILKNDECVPALINMGNIYVIKEDYELALAYYNRAYKRVPNLPGLLINIAKVYYELSDDDNAKKAYDRLKDSFPDIAAGYEYLVSEQDEKNRSAQALSKESLEWEKY